MSDIVPPPNRVWLTLWLRDDDLLCLGRAALNLHAAVQFAHEHGLAMHEDPSKDYFDLALLVPTPRLADVLPKLTDAGITIGTVDCFDHDAHAVCQALPVVSVLIDQADGSSPEPARPPSIG